jgi:hypothetical protein
VTIPAQLVERISEALGALYRHPNQTLLAWYRYAIYDALLADGSHGSYAARAWLDVLSVQHVLFCWQPYARTSWPATWMQPTTLLALAEQLLLGQADSAIVQQTTHAQALADVAGESAASAHYPAWCVFEAALRALQSAWEYHNPEIIAGALSNRRADANVLDDASRYAAIAIAGSLTFTRGAPQMQTTFDQAVAPAHDAAQLRQTFFWEWWLREAIPNAWQRR